MNNNKRVICYDTGIIYNSVQEAARAVDRANSAISLAIKHKHKCAGLHWGFYFEFNENLLYNSNVIKKKGDMEKK